MEKIIVILLCTVACVYAKPLIAATNNMAGAGQANTALLVGGELLPILCKSLVSQKPLISDLTACFRFSPPAWRGRPRRSRPTRYSGRSCSCSSTPSSSRRSYSAGPCSSWFPKPSSRSSCSSSPWPLWRSRRPSCRSRAEGGVKMFRTPFDAACHLSNFVLSCCDFSYDIVHSGVLLQ